MLRECLCTIFRVASFLFFPSPYPTIRGRWGGGSKGEKRVLGGYLPTTPLRATNWVTSDHWTGGPNGPKAQGKANSVPGPGKRKGTSRTLCRYPEDRRGGRSNGSNGVVGVDSPVPTCVQCDVAFPRSGGRDDKCTGLGKKERQMYRAREKGTTNVPG